MRWQWRRLSSGAWPIRIRRGPRGSRARARGSSRGTGRVGKEDILTPPAFSRELAGLIPGARLRVLPGAHAFFLEEAPRINGTLLDFFKGVKR
jgi:pimeloyl-ACP methyl ester carboxylesterase